MQQWLDVLSGIVFDSVAQGVASDALLANLFVSFVNYSCTCKAAYNDSAVHMGPIDSLRRGEGKGDDGK